MRLGDGCVGSWSVREGRSGSRLFAGEGAEGIGVMETDDCGHHLEEGDGIDIMRGLSAIVAYQCGMSHVG